MLLLLGVWGLGFGQPLLFNQLLSVRYLWLQLIIESTSECDAREIAARALVAYDCDIDEGFSMVLIGLAHANSPTSREGQIVFLLSSRVREIIRNSAGKHRR